MVSSLSLSLFFILCIASIFDMAFHMVDVEWCFGLWSGASYPTLIWLAL